MDGSEFDRIAKLFAERRLSRRRAVRHGAAGLAAAGFAAAGITTAAAAAPSAIGAAPSTTGGAERSDLVTASFTPPAHEGFTVLADTPAAATAVASPVPEEDKETMFLFLQSFETGSLVPKTASPDEYTLTLRKGLGETVFFSDRPQKIAGTMPTPAFLDALGFPPDNPPNAALIGHRSATHKDIVVVELFDPHYDTSNNTATYDVKLLQDWHKLDETFEQTPDDAKHLPRDFTAAHLFIDDCADRDRQCGKGFRATSSVGTLRSTGQCFRWLTLACEDCDDYSGLCNATFPECEGNCHIISCGPNGLCG